MIGRFLLGAGLGGLVGTGLLAIVSVVSPGPGANGPFTPGPLAGKETPPDEALALAAPEGAEGVPLTEAEPEEAAAPVVSEPVPAVEPELPAALTEPAEPSAPASPEVAVEPEPVEAPEPAVTVAEAPVPAVADAPEAPAVAALDETGPATPLVAEEPTLSTVPAAPAELAGDDTPAPAEVPAEAPAIEAAAAPDAPLAPELADAGPSTPEALADAAPATAGPAQPGAPLAEAAPAPAEPSGLPPLTPEEEEMLARIAAEGPGSALQPEEALPEVVADAVPEAAPEPPAEQPAQAAEAAPEQPSLLTEREDDKILRTEDSGSTLPSTPALAGASDAVTVGRLPRIGEAAEEPAEPAEVRPMVLFAEAFDNPEGKPAFAIVLIDEGDAATDRDALAALPFPVTFALDPSNPMAADHAAIYRAAGKEVAMLATALPKGAQAADIEVALSAMTAVLPESVAVMDTPSRAFQGDRPLSTLVVPVVGAGGRGLLTWDQGLNAADQVARREQIASAVAFRDLDGAEESGAVIRRYLDRAAFKAAQDGRVTVVGRTRPETVAALLEWAVEGRAATVALAPLTAVLSAN